MKAIEMSRFNNLPRLELDSDKILDPSKGGQPRKHVIIRQGTLNYQAFRSQAHTLTVHG